MKFIIESEKLLQPLRYVNNPIESKPISPILGNILLQVIKNKLFITGTNLEMEMIAIVNLTYSYKQGSITVQAKKIFNIFRNFSKKTIITVINKKNKLLIKSGNSKYYLSTLPALNFPKIKKYTKYIEFIIETKILKKLLLSTYFSMANQDVRYYLNGMLIEINNNIIYSVSTNGHRLSFSKLTINTYLKKHSFIIPRKCVIELIKILEFHKMNNLNNKLIKIMIGKNYIRFYIDKYIFTSKLIDGIFPNYKYIIPKIINNTLIVNRILLKNTLVRISVISNEKFKSATFLININELKIIVTNSIYETAEEIIKIIYKGNTIEITLNINYLLDVINILKEEKICISYEKISNSIIIQNYINKDSIYIIMPIKI